MALDIVVCVLFVLFGIGAIVLGVTNGGLWLALVAVGALLILLGLVGGSFAVRGRINDRIKRTRGY
ncbi:MAG: hypothetical protein QOD63_1226 [Actinomycetota bacterium]|jgi:hypothetical protein|nr:hypothetical protein [Actinomycetota bacterium]